MPVERIILSPDFFEIDSSSILNDIQHYEVDPKANEKIGDFGSGL